MDGIVSRFLLVGGKFVPEIHSRQTAALCKPEFT